MFRATMCPSSGELTVSMRHWYFSLCMGGCLLCRLDMMGTYLPETCTEVEINTLRSSVHLVGFLLLNINLENDVTKMTCCIGEKVVKTSNLVNSST